jgi:AcrR family transcriptional regulator
MEATRKPRRRLSPDLRRQQILDAAIVIFRDQEYSAVSLELVAERAGATRGLVHHYFGIKRDLFLAVVEDAVRIPPSIDLIPAGMTGDLRDVVRASVVAWMTMIESAGGLWLGAADSGGFGGSDLDLVISRARDELVDRMIDEFPFPADLDRELLRSALKCFAALARVATEEWLVTKALTEEQTAVLLEEALMALVDSVVPAMGDSGGSGGRAD